jgi:hypothetical protein
MDWSGLHITHHIIEISFILFTLCIQFNKLVKLQLIIKGFHAHPLRNFVQVSFAKLNSCCSVICSNRDVNESSEFSSTISNSPESDMFSDMFSSVGEVDMSWF